MSVKVNIGANSADFQRQMKQVTQQLKSVQVGFNSASEKAKTFGSVTDQLKAKQSELANKIRGQNTIIAMNRDYIRQLNKEIVNYKNNNSQLASKIADLERKQQQATEQFGKGSKEVRDLDSQLSKLKNQYSANERAITNCDNKITSQNTKLEANKKALYQTQKALKDVEKELNTTGSRFGQMGEKAGSIAGKMTPLSLGLTGVGVASAKMAMDLETNMAKIDTIAGVSKEQLGSMKQGIIELSDQTGYSSKEISDDVYEAISSGQSAGDAINFVSNATKLATAGFTSSSTAVDVLTSALNAYGLKASDISNVNDTLIKTQNLGKITIDELGKSIGQVIPTAATFGVSLQQLGAGYAELTARGVKPAEATTQLNSMFNQLGKSTTVVSKALKKVSGESFQDLMKQGKSVGDVIKILNDYAKSSGQNLNDLFSDVEAGKAAMSIANGGDQFNDFLNQMANSAGSTDEAVKKMEETTGFKLNKALNQGKNAMIEFGDTMSPVISAGANALSLLSTALQHLTNTQKTWIVGLGAGFVALNGGLFAFSKMASVVSTNINMFKKAGKGIKDFVTGVKDGTSKISPFLNAMKSVGSVIGENTKKLALNTAGIAKNIAMKTADIAKTVALTTAKLAQATATKTVEVAQTALNIVMNMNPIGLILISITALIAGLVLLYTKCDWFRNLVNKMFAEIKTGFTTLLTITKQVFTTIITSITAFGSMLWSKVGFIFTNMWTIIKDIFAGGLLLLLDLVTGNFTLLKSDLQVILESISNSFTNILTGIKTGAVQIFTAIKTAIIAKVTELKNNAVQSFITLKDNVINTVINLKNSAVSTFENIKNSIITTAENAKNGIIQGFSNMKNGAINIIYSLKNGAINVFESILNFFYTLPSRLYSIGSQMFSSMRNGVTGSIYGVKNAIVSGISSALSYLASLPSRAYRYGVDFIQGMVNGIRNMIGSVENAVSNVANTIRSYLHFSVPDVGPLTDYESWMPDFLNGLSKGIEKNKGLVKNAVNGLAGDIKTGLKGEINLSSQNATITHVIDDYKNNKEKNNRFIQVNLQVGTKTIASTLVDDLGKIISKKQGARGITKGVLSNI